VTFVGTPTSGFFRLAFEPRAVDSSLAFLQDRPTFVNVKSQAGIPASNIIAPLVDRFGQTRVDDPRVDPPPGLGSNVFQDRGAIERADFVGPTIAIDELVDVVGATTPGTATDQDPDATELEFERLNPTRFVFRLSDTGIGIDDATVRGAAFVLTRNGTALIEGTDYLFNYDTNTKQVFFIPATGRFDFGLYTLTVDNSTATGIRDQAGNGLLPNRTGGVTQFTIDLVPPPQFVVSDLQTVETDSGNVRVFFRVTLTESVATPTSVNYRITDNSPALGAATAGVAYSVPGGLTGTLNFAANQTFRDVLIDVLPDTLPEGTETFFINLESPQGGPDIGDALGVGTIVDNDSPTVSISDAVVSPEGDSGTKTASFTVTLSKAVGVDVIVNYSTADLPAGPNSATAGADYLAVPAGSVTILAGQLTATIPITVRGDLDPESLERFTVNVTSARTAGGIDLGVTDGLGLGAIVDDDSPSITVADTGAAEGSGFVDVVVRLSKVVNVPLTVDYSVLPGTALANSDYDGAIDPLTGTLTFPANTTTQTIRIRLLGGGGAEPVETFRVVLSNPSVGTITDGDATVRIVDETNVIGLVTAPNAGAEPRVFVFDAAGNPRLNPSFYAYSPAFKNGVRVALGDVDGNGVTDIVVAPVSGIAPIRVFRSDSYAEIANFFPFAQAYTGGVAVATGDINFDGKDEIFASTTSTNPADGGTSVRVFAVVNRVGVLADPSSSFFAFAPHFTGGALIAAGDVNGDGRADAVVTPISGAGPAVAMFNYNGTFINSFYAFDPNFTGGANIAVGDVNGDGTDDVVASVRGGAQPTVRVFSGFSGTLLSTFQAFSPAFSGGVNVGVGDINFDGRADVIAAPASNSPAAVRFFDGLSGAILKSVVPNYPTTFTNGIFVAGQFVDTPGQPLQLTGFSGGGNAAAAVTQAQVQTLTKAAITRLTAAGGSSVAMKLANVRIGVADLPANYLGLARTGSIVIDVNAGGQGWFIDETPSLDEEFARGVDGTYRAVAPQAQGKVDLLTVLTHELAHLIGFDDLDSAVAPNSLMTGTITGGVRRATKEHLDDVFADGDVLSELLTV